MKVVIAMVGCDGDLVVNGSIHSRKFHPVVCPNPYTQRAIARVKYKLGTESRFTLYWNYVDGHKYKELDWDNLYRIKPLN